MSESSGFWAAMARSPTTLVVVAVVVASEVAFHRWFAPGPAMSAGMLALGTGLLALWPPLFARSPGWRDAQLAARGAVEEMTVSRIQALEATLARLHADDAVEQLRSLRAKLASVSDVVEQRLDAGELAFARYRATAEQVYLSAVDNLQDVAVALSAIASIDPQVLAERERALAGSDAPELASLRERRRLYDEQHDKIRALMAQNEAAMTALSNTAAALADVRTRAGHASVDADTAMAELEALAARAGRYDTRPGTGRA